MSPEDQAKSKFEAEADRRRPALIVVEGDVAPVARPGGARLEEKIVGQRDLDPGGQVDPLVLPLDKEQRIGLIVTAQVERGARDQCDTLGHRKFAADIRSEGRSVGKECVSTCRSRWWQYN